MATNFLDLVVVGGGPAGLAAAINAASEGLSTMLVDSKERLGGQASASSLVENYPGFPDGISGKDLTGLFIQQASKFKTSFLRPVVVRGMVPNGGSIVVTTDDEEHRRVETRAVVLALGLSYRKLSAPGVADFLGRGVFYGTSPVDLQGRNHRVCIVGGSNSAGQAAMHLSSTGCRVRLLVRSPNLQMSNYLAERVRANSKIEILLDTEVQEVTGGARMECVVVKNPSGKHTLEADGLCIFIGASPKTYWLNGVVDQTSRGYIVTGKSGAAPFETSMPGVFAAGDVREGSIKRIASAVGEGSVVVQQVLAYLASKDSASST